MPEHIIARAFQLARSGECRSLGEIRDRLRREQFAQIEVHLAGKSIRAQLMKAMAEARR